MTFQIGRITGMQEPLNWDDSLSRTTITGGFTGASVNAGIATRNQLLGLVNNADEPVIPIVSGADASVNGYYRVTGVDIPTPPAALINGHFDYSIQLERVNGFQAATCESMITGALMVNALGVATGTAEPFHGFPNTSLDYNNSVAITQLSRPLTPGGNVGIARMQPNYKALARFTMPPAKFYDAACTINSAQPVDHVVIGRQDAPGNSLNDAAWTLANGVVQVKPIVSSPGWQIWWTDATPGFNRTTITVQINQSIGGNLTRVTDVAGVKILRNAPEEIILRLPVVATTPSVTVGITYVDISIRRASRVVRFYVVCSVATQTWTLANNVAHGATALTGGQMWTSVDAFGNKVVLFSALASTNDLVNNSIAITGARATADMGVSFEIAGGAGQALDSGQSQVYQYLAAQAERMQIVGR